MRHDPRTYYRQLWRDFKLMKAKNSCGGEGGGEGEFDPAVQQLLAGMAYLLAGQQQLFVDHERLQWQWVLQEFVPSLFQPLVAHGVVQGDDVLVKPMSLPRGTQLVTQRQGKSLYVETLWSVKLLPLKVVDCCYQQQDAFLGVISLTVQCQQGFRFSTLLGEELILFIDDDLQGDDILYCLLHQLVDVEVIVNDQRYVLENFGLESYFSEVSVAPALDRALRRIQLFCVFPALFRFIRIRLPQACWCQVKEDSLTLRIQFYHRGDDYSFIDSGTFKLNCVPVLNQWCASSEPIKADGRQLFYPIRLHHHQSDQAVVSVDNITFNPLDRTNQPFVTEVSQSVRQQAYQVLYRTKQCDVEPYLWIHPDRQRQDTIVSMDVIACDQDRLRQICHEARFTLAKENLNQSISLKQVSEFSRFKLSNFSQDVSQKLFSLASDLMESSVSLAMLQTLLQLGAAHELSASLQDCQVQAGKDVYRSCTYDVLSYRVIFKEHESHTSSWYYVSGYLLHQLFVLLRPPNILIGTQVYRGQDKKVCQWTMHPGVSGSYIG